MFKNAYHRKLGKYRNLERDKKLLIFPLLEIKFLFSILFYTVEITLYVKLYIQLLFSLKANRKYFPHVMKNFT